MTDDDLTRITQTLIVRPGDTLLVRVAYNICEETAVQLKAKLAELLPEVPVLVLAVDELAVYRP